MSTRLREALRFLHLSAIQIAGRRYWLVPFAVLLWPALQGGLIWIGWRRSAFQPVEAQTLLLGAPLALLAALLGSRIVAAWVEDRTIEVVYAAPGASRAWAGGLVAAGALVVCAETVLAVVVVALFTAFPPSALFAALAAALLYLVLAMFLGALSRSVVTGSALAVVVLAVNALLAPFLGRFSPFWNPGAYPEMTSYELLAATVQNRTGVLILIVVFTGLALRLAQDRERLLRS